ncbi:MAG: hypothetical protein BJ554DRAFT_3142, partial [Olpidium bornovanus]
MPDATSRNKIAADYVLDAPPGEINDVLHGTVPERSQGKRQNLPVTTSLVCPPSSFSVRLLGLRQDRPSDPANLVGGNDATLQSYIVPALRQYNTEQLSTVTLPGADYEQVVISKYNQLEEDVFVDPRSKKKFTLDQALLVSLREVRSVWSFQWRKVEASDPSRYAGSCTLLRQTTSSIENVELGEFDELRSAVDDAAQKYIREHYPKGAVSAFSAGDEKVVVCIVASKYNPNNFWSVRAELYYPADKKLCGRMHGKVHYYEDGNVQFEAAKEDLTFSIESDGDHATTAKEIFQAVTKAETKFQNAVNESFLNLLEG